MTDERIVITLKDENNVIEEEINLHALANAVLVQFKDSRKYWRDPALEWRDLEQEIYLSVIELITENDEIPYDSSKSKLITWLYMFATSRIKNYLNRKIGVVTDSPDAKEVIEPPTFEPYFNINENGEVEDKLSEEEKEPSDHYLTYKLYELLDPISADILVKLYNLESDDYYTMSDLGDMYSMSKQAVNNRIERAFKLLRKDEDLQKEIELITGRSVSSWS